MPEGILIRDKIDKAFPAVAVQLPDILRRQAVKVCRLLGVRSILEAVALHIQLELIVFEGRKKIDHGFDRFHARHLPAADIQHIAASFQLRPVVNPHTRDLPARGFQHLLQGCDSPEQAFITGNGQHHGVFADFNAVFFALQRSILFYADPALPVPDPAEERHEVRVGCADGKDQRAFQVFNTSGLRKKKHHPCLLLIQLDPGHPGKDSTLSEKTTYPGVLYNLRPSFVIRPGLSFREEKTLSRHPEQRVFCRMVFTV